VVSAETLQCLILNFPFNLIPSRLNQFNWSLCTRPPPYLLKNRLLRNKHCFVKYYKHQEPKYMTPEMYIFCPTFKTKLTFTTACAISPCAIKFITKILLLTPNTIQMTIQNVKLHLIYVQKCILLFLSSNSHKNHAYTITMCIPSPSVSLAV